MPTIILAMGKQPKHDKDVNAKIQNFLVKLGIDDTSSGLHIEPINGSKDQRFRTGRVDQFWRAVLFRVDPPGGETHYVYTGTWRHDDAIAKAKVASLHTNPVSGVLELRDAVAATAPSGDVGVGRPASAPKKSNPLLAECGYSVNDLVVAFGFDEATAEGAFIPADEDQLLTYAESLTTAWQQDVLLSMAAHEALDDIMARLHLDRPVDVPDGADDDTRIVEALKHPASRMQFTYIGDDHEELQRVIEGGDFGAWRVFLHPEQQEHVDKDFNGPFRLSGGAGTGKTVVLLHRARRLAAADPQARVVLTTFTRALAENLRRDLERLDPSVRIAAHLGEPGVFICGADQLASEVRARAGGGFVQSSIEALGSAREVTASLASPDWHSAIAQAGSALPVALQSEPFFTDEYAQVVLPHGITTAEDYFLVRRPGRGVALDRARRVAVWAVIEQMRKDQRISGTLGFGDIAAISSQWLKTTATTFADHVLVDEGQDLEPTKWKLLRAIVPRGRNDLFIAEDAHQRIYGKPTVLKRYGVDIVGRSRRLRLNYRTTVENLRYAMRILSGVPYEDEEGVLSTDGYRSARSGPKPTVHAATSDAEQLDLIASEIVRWVADEVRPETIAILVSTNAAAKKVQQGLSQRGRSVASISEPRVTGGQPVLMTMHTAKGMEFSRVVAYDVSDGTFPPPFVYKSVPEEDKPDKDKQFRSLLYVALSRARDQLVVTYKGAPSTLLLG